MKLSQLTKIGIAIIAIGVIVFLITSYMDRVLHYGSIWPLEIIGFIIALGGSAAVYKGRSQEQKLEKERAIKQLEAQRQNRNDK